MNVAASIAPAQRLGRFELRRILGKGALGGLFSRSVDPATRYQYRASWGGSCTGADRRRRGALAYAFKVISKRSSGEAAGAGDGIEQCGGNDARV